MQKLILTSALAAILIVPAIGAAPPRAETADVPRDLTEHDAALAEVQSQAAAWSEAVSASDSARAAYDEALAALNAALDAEASARTSLETAQADYASAYDDVPKEDQLLP